MITYMGPFTTAYMIEIKRTAQSEAEMAKFFSFFGVFVGTFKALDMIATGYLMEISLDNLFIILACLVIANMILNFLRKNICFQ